MLEHTLEIAINRMLAGNWYFHYPAVAEQATVGIAITVCLLFRLNYTQIVVHKLDLPAFIACSTFCSLFIDQNNQ